MLVLFLCIMAVFAVGLMKIIIEFVELLKELKECISKNF